MENYATVEISIIQEPIKRGQQTASGCFHGHDKLLSIAPIVILALFTSCKFRGVVDLLVAVIESWRL